MANTDNGDKRNINLTKLKLLAINVNSIVANQRRASLTNTLKLQNPDVVFLSETKLKPNHVISFKNYKIIRSDRADRDGGGTAIIIKKGIPFSKVNIIISQERSILEFTVVKIKAKTNTYLYLIACYAPCGTQKEFIPDLSKLFEKLKLDREQNFFIMAGDLNAKHTAWLNAGNNPRGISLDKWLVNNEHRYRLKLYCTQFPSYPFGNSYLDLFMADARIDFLNTVDFFKLPNIPYDSDHNAVMAQIELPINVDIPPDGSLNVNKFNYKKTNWEKFAKTLKTDFKLDIPNDRNLSKAETIDYLKKIDKIICEVRDRIVPKIRPRDLVDTYVTHTIEELQRFKSHILSRLHRLQRSWPSVNSAMLRILKDLLRDVKSRLKIEFAKSVSEYWEKRIRGIPVNDSASMFPQVNQIFRKKGIAEIAALKIPNAKKNVLNDYNIDCTNTTLMDNNDIIANNMEDKLNIIGAFFASINNDVKTDENKFTEIINKKARVFLDMSYNDTLCSFNDSNYADDPFLVNDTQNFFVNTAFLEKKFRKLNNKKSSGIDTIPNVVLKHLPVVVIRAYAILFNNLLNHKFFPPHWKKAKVVAILKKDKDSSNPLNYRPISLLPNIGKVYEMVINDAILSVCTNNNVMPESQFGFRYKHSTLHAINKFTSDICWALNENKCVGACLIDLEKAFDSVWHEGLIVKLIQKKFPRHLIETIWSMIRERSFVTFVGSHESSVEFRINNGLQQGTVNSPVLFNIFTSDVLKLFGPMSEYPVQSIAFADDLIIYHADSWSSRIQNKLQDVFERIHSYYRSWKLKINTQKCETILFRPSLAYVSRDVRKNYKTFAVRESRDSENIIPHKKCVRYLGIYIDQKLKYNIHVETQLNKARRTFLMNKRLFYSKYLHYKIKLICYQLLIRPIITYGCPIWFNISASQMERIRLFERRCLRVCMSMFVESKDGYKKYYSNKKIYNKAGIPRIDNFIIKLIRDHFANASRNKSNSLIFSAFYPNPLYHAKTLSSGFIPPEVFLYMDTHGYIQDETNIPTIYHVPRHKNKKSILYIPTKNCLSGELKIKYSTAMSDKDQKDAPRQNTKKYWWRDT